MQMSDPDSRKKAREDSRYIFFAGADISLNGEVIVA